MIIGLRAAGFNKKTVFGLLGTCFAVVALGLWQGLPDQQVQVTAADLYDRVFPISTGAVVLPFLFCIVRAEFTQLQRQIPLAVRLGSRLQWLAFVLKSNLLCSLFVVGTLNLAAGVILLRLGCQMQNVLLPLLLCFCSQALYFLILSMLQQLVLFWSKKMYASYLAAIAYSAFDFIALNTMAEPIFLGWGLSQLPWRGSFVLPVLLPAVLVVCLVAVMGVLLSLMDLLPEVRRA